MLKPPKGCADHGTGTFAVDVEIAHEKLIASLLDLLRILAENSAGQSVFGIVGQLQRMLEIARLGHRQHRNENLLLEETRLGVDIGDHRWLDKISVSRSRRATSHQPPFFFPDLNIIKNQRLAPSLITGPM